MDERWRPSPRTALLTASGLFALGIGAHLAFAAAARRPTPITLFAFGPPVSVLAYLRARPDAGERRVAAVLLWGVVATGAAFVGVFLAVESFSYVPRDRTAYELFRFDLDLYVWFVLSLAGVTGAAGTFSDDARSLALLAAAPLVQASVPVALVLLEQWLVAGGG